MIHKDHDGATLTEAVDWQSTDDSSPPLDGTTTVALPEFAASPRVLANQRRIERWLMQRLAQTLQIPADQIDPRKLLAALGVDSLIAMEVSVDLQQWLGCTLSPDMTIVHPTIHALSLHLAQWCHDMGIEVESDVDESLSAVESNTAGRRASCDLLQDWLQEQDSIRAAQVCEYTRRDGTTGLLVGFVPRLVEDCSLISLRLRLRLFSPEYGASLALVPLEELPTPSPDRSAPAELLASLMTTPRNSLEETLAESWDLVARMVGIGMLDGTPSPGDVGVFENFCSWGCGAMQRLQMAALAIEEGLRLTPSLVEEHPSIAELAELLSRPGHLPSAGTPDQSTSAVSNDLAQAPAVVDAGQVSPISMVIESLGVYLPPRVASTDEILQGCKEEVTFPLELVTGIHTRRMAGTDEFAIDLAAKAVARCLAASGKQPQDIDLVICSSIARYDGFECMTFEPGTAVRLKKQFGFDPALAFDISNACAGMFTAIKVVESYLAAGTAQSALVVSGEYISHLTLTAQKEISGFKDDRLACLTVGDAGAAVILERRDLGQVGFHDVDLYTLGRYSDLCIGKATDHEHGGAIMYTQSSKMASVAIEHSVLHTSSTCVNNQWSRDTADHIIMHQTSKSSIDAAVQATNLFANKEVRGNAINNLTERGNTASTSHFVALWDAIHDGQIKSRQRVAFPVQASGLTVGTALYTLDDLPDRLRATAAGKPPASGSRPHRGADRPSQTTPCGVRIESIGVLPSPVDDSDKNTVALAAAAAKRCFERSRYQPDDIDLLIFAGVYRSEFLTEPAVSTLLAGELGINADVDPLAKRKTFGFDITNGSMGFLNACDVARQAISAWQYKTVMVIASEIENNTLVHTERLRGVKETASAIILDRSPSNREGFERMAFSYYTDHVDALRCEARLAGGKAYLKMEQDPDLEEYYLECLAKSVRQFLQAEPADAPRPTVILPPQISPSFVARLASRLELGNETVVNVADADKELFTSSLPFALEAAREQGHVAGGDLGLILDVTAGIQVVCATYRFP